MSISGVGAGYSEWREIRKAQKNNSGIGFVGRMADMDTTESSSSQRTSVRISAFALLAEVFDECRDSFRIYSKTGYKKTAVKCSMFYNSLF